MPKSAEEAIICAIFVDNRTSAQNATNENKNY